MKEYVQEDGEPSSSILGSYRFVVVRSCFLFSHTYFEVSVFLLFRVPFRPFEAETLVRNVLFHVSSDREMSDVVLHHSVQNFGAALVLHW